MSGLFGVLGVLGVLHLGGQVEACDEQKACSAGVCGWERACGYSAASRDLGKTRLLSWVPATATAPPCRRHPPRDRAHHGGRGEAEGLIRVWGAAARGCSAVQCRRQAAATRGHTTGLGCVNQCLAIR